MERPTSCSSDFSGSVKSAGGVICCFRPEPLGRRGEFKDVVEELYLLEMLREEERGLCDGLAASPGPR